jgi:hypothetical protein
MANEVLEVIGRGARDAILVASGSFIISVDLVGGFEDFDGYTGSTGRTIRPAGTDGVQPSAALRKSKTRKYNISSSFEPLSGTIIEKKTLLSIDPPVSASDVGFPVIVSPGVPFFEPSFSLKPGGWKGEWITPGPTSSLAVPITGSALIPFLTASQAPTGPTASFAAPTASLFESPPVDNTIWRITVGTGSA